MNKTFSNKNRMFQTVAEVTETYKSVWETVPIFVIIFTEFKALLAKIMTTAQAAGVDLTGVTAGKNTNLDSLAVLVYEFCSNLALFAIRSNNPGLLAKVSLSEYDIKKKKDGDLIIFANEVMGLANQHKASLTDYAMDEADITKLSELIALTKKELPVPEAKYSDRKTAHAELEKLFGETTDFLEEQLDRAVDTIRSRNATFYNAYYFSRNIKNIGIRHDAATTAKAEEKEVSPQQD